MQVKNKAIVGKNAFAHEFIEKLPNQPWPYWPMKLKTTSSHQEGVERFFSVSTKEFIGDDKGQLRALKTVEVEWIFKQGERPELKEVLNSEKIFVVDKGEIVAEGTHNELLIDSAIYKNFYEKQIKKV